MDDVVSGNRRDNSVGPAAILLVGHRLEHPLGERGADHRADNRQHRDDRIDRCRLVDQAAVIDPVVAALAVAASLIGTTLARPVLEMLTDNQYRVWATRMITAIACYYLGSGGYLLALPLM